MKSRLVRLFRVLVALYSAGDPLHGAALRWMTGYRGTLHTVGSVSAGTAWQLPARDRSLIAGLASQGIVRLHTPDAAGFARMARLLGTYADLDPDWADIELVWLAESTGIRRLATLDVADLSVYRIHGRKRFELEMLR